MSQNAAATPAAPAAPRKNFGLVWIIAAFALLSVAGVVWWLVAGRNTTDTAPATSTATAAGTAGAAADTTADTTAGTDTSATPPPAGAARAMVPDLTSDPRPVDRAILALQKKGFAVALAGRPDPQNRPGFVVDQTPAGNTSLPQGSVVRLTIATRTDVDLTLSEEDSKRLSADAAERFRSAFAGEVMVIVPPVEGRRIIDAMLALQRRGLHINVEVIAKYENFPLLVVGSQNPTADESVAAGTTVEIKCLGNEIDATPEEAARLSRENVVILKRARQELAQARFGR